MRTHAPTQPENGHLAVLRWDENTDVRGMRSLAQNAAGGGHLGVLRWARKNGCPWDAYTRIQASLHGYSEAVT